MNQSPVMAERMRQTKNRILQTAKDIFLEQGCRRTTIRQIVERSGITSGSIYNIFSSKEEIFNTLAGDVLENCIRMVQKEAGGESPLYQYAAVLLVEMEAIARDERVRELYQEAYTSPAMFEAAVNRHVRLEMKIFGESYGKLFKEDTCPELHGEGGHGRLHQFLLFQGPAPCGRSGIPSSFPDLQGPGKQEKGYPSHAEITGPEEGGMGHDGKGYPEKIERGKRFCHGCIPGIRFL